MVAAAGVVCALGYDAATAFAAARAQISRASVQPHYRIRSDVEGVEEPVVGHSADLLTLGFELEGRLLRMTQGTLQQLFADDAAKLVWRRRLGLYGALSRPGRTQSDGDEDDDTPAPEPAALATRTLRRALIGAAWPAEPTKLLCSIDGGHTVGVRALGAAVRDLNQGAVDAAVVVAVDSLLDEITLHQLHSRGRLKCDGAPAGLQPGEAAVALLLLNAAGGDATPGAQARPQTRIATLCMDDEPKSFIERQASTGEALARALAAAGNGRIEGRAWVLSDHNGEHYRANEWGCAWARLRAQEEAYAEAEVWYPALSFGDTGAASTLIAVAMARQAHLRGYAPSRTALVASAADGPERGALLLQHH